MCAGVRKTARSGRSKGSIDDPFAGFIPARGKGKPGNKNALAPLHEGIAGKNIPRAQNNFNKILLDPERKERFLAALRNELDVQCELRPEYGSPLRAYERKAIRGMEIYVEVYGFFPREKDLKEQGLTHLQEAMDDFGGAEKIRKAIGAEGPRFVAPAKRSPSCPKPKPKKAPIKPVPKSLLLTSPTKKELQKIVHNKEKLKQFEAALWNELRHSKFTCAQDIRNLLDALRIYLRIFEFFPTAGVLHGQNLSAIAGGISKHGGYPKLREDLGISCLIPMPKKAPSLEHKPRARKTGNMSDKFVVLSDDCSGVKLEDVFRTKRFVFGYARLVREKKSKQKEKTYVALAQKRLKIPVLVEGGGRVMSFRERDIPGLLLAVDLKIGPKQVAGDAVNKLVREFNSAKAVIPNWLALKLWVGREFMVDNAGTPKRKLPTDAIRALNELINMNRMMDLVFETYSKYLPEGPSLEDNLRRSSSINMESIDY